MTRWGIGLGALLLVTVLVVRPWLPAWFSDDPQVQAMIAGALIVVALMQPLAGVVFVLDGVLLGAGDAVSLVCAQLAALLAFAPAAWAVLSMDGTVTALWIALAVFMAARALAFLVRIRGQAWLVTGATR